MTIGLRRGTVRLEPYDPAWARHFSREAARIRKALGDRIEDIQHVGSTSVPGLLAKPVIDIAIAIRDLADVDDCVEPLETLGYLYFGDQEKRGDHFFAKGPDRTRTHYVHVVESGSSNWNEYLLFRDRLRENPNLRNRYARLKQKLADLCADDRKTYTKRKKSFIERVVEQATGQRRAQRSREKPASEWFHTFADDLWLRPDALGAEEAAFIRKALRLRKGSRALDAPCGAGRIAIHLARAGCAVTGIDLQPSFLRRARARFRKERVSGRFLAMDLREMAFREEFDGIYNWFGSFGYFSDSENAAVIERCAAALRKGGRLLIDQLNRERVLRRFVASNVTHNLTIKTRWNLATQRIESDWIVVRDDTRQHNRLSIRLYTPREMRTLFEKAGLAVERLYGSFVGEPYRRSGRRLIMVGRKRSDT
ncbi:MAG: GrpB family protein [Candidatus Sumerlaeota bacterium]|nr:GrpB family protein [Candidatus Sumerlaeota bacterium]